MSDSPLKSAPISVGAWSSFRRHVGPILWRQRGKLLLGIFALMVVDLIQLEAPRLIGVAIDAMGKGESIWRPASALFAVGLCVAALRWVWRVSFVGASYRVRRDLRSRLFDQVLDLGTEARARYQSGDILTRSSSDVDAVGMACGFGVLAATDALVMILLVAGRVPAKGGSQALWALLPLPFMALWVLWAGRQIHRRFGAVQQSNSVLAEEARELLAATRYVKGSGRSDALGAGFAKANQDQRHSALKLVALNSCFDPVILALAALAQAILLYAAGLQVIDGQLSLGAVSELAGYVALLTWPAMAIGWSVNLIQRGSVAAQRIGEVIDEVNPIQDPEDAKELPPLRHIHTENLELYYGEEQILAEISIRLQQGQMIGLVGPSGSGKSSLLRCLARLQAVPEQSLFYQGIAAEELLRADARRSVAFAAQEPVLFALTVRENIALANPDLPMEAVIRAAQAAGIHEDLAALPDGYNSMLGERGLTLSGGQRARVGLARALASEVPFLLLDDCLAAVDGDRAAEIVAGLQAAVGQRGALVVAHRLATVVNCDHILVLEHGRITEEGTHASLMKLGGHYVKNWALQHGEEQSNRSGESHGGI